MVVCDLDAGVGLDDSLDPKDETHGGSDEPGHLEVQTTSGRVLR